MSESIKNLSLFFIRGQSSVVALQGILLYCSLEWFIFDYSISTVRRFCNIYSERRLKMIWHHSHRIFWERICFDCKQSEFMIVYGREPQGYKCWGSINYLESFLYNTPLYFRISGIIFPSFVFTFTIYSVSSLLLY